MRRAARQDGNHKEIAAEFEKYGCAVAHTHQVGRGFSDLVISRNQINVLVEIKKPKGKLTPDQIAFRERWQGPYEVVESKDDVREVVRRICMECL